MIAPHYVAVFCKGVFWFLQRRRWSLRSAAEAAARFNRRAGQRDDCWAYVLPGDLAEMYEREQHDEADHCFALVYEADLAMQQENVDIPF